MTHCKEIRSGDVCGPPPPTRHARTWDPCLPVSRRRVPGVPLPCASPGPSRPRHVPPPGQCVGLAPAPARPPREGTGSTSRPNFCQGSVAGPWGPLRARPDVRPAPLLPESGELRPPPPGSAALRDGRPFSPCRHPLPSRSGPHTPVPRLPHTHPPRRSSPLPPRVRRLLASAGSSPLGRSTPVPGVTPSPTTTPFLPRRQRRGSGRRTPVNRGRGVTSLWGPGTETASRDAGTGRLSRDGAGVGEARRGTRSSPTGGPSPHPPACLPSGSHPSETPPTRRESGRARRPG